jgi:hypothetical protein
MVVVGLIAMDHDDPTATTTTELGLPGDMTPGCDAFCTNANQGRIEKYGAKAAAEVMQRRCACQIFGAGCATCDECMNQ